MAAVARLTRYCPASAATDGSGSPAERSPAAIRGVVYGDATVLESGLKSGLRTALVNGTVNGIGAGLAFGLMHRFAAHFTAGCPVSGPSRPPDASRFTALLLMIALGMVIGAGYRLVLGPTNHARQDALTMEFDALGLPATDRRSLVLSCTLITRRRSSRHSAPHNSVGLNRPTMRPALCVRWSLL